MTDNEDKTVPQVAGIILAAGSASRMGQPKLLLPWNGKALICHAAQTAIEAQLEPVVIVTGAHASEIETALTGLAVQFVYNPDWGLGQSTSVRTGISALPGRVEAVMFLLGDQPFVTVELIENLVLTYTQTRSVVLAPFVGERRTNPVLFDHSIFDTLCTLQGDAGARSIFAKYPPTPMPWHDERLLFDVDTPDDYRNLLRFSA